MKKSTWQSFLIIALVVCISFTSVFSVDSVYKFRLYKNFLKDFFEMNLNQIFMRTNNLKIKDAQLEDSKAMFTQIVMDLQNQGQKR